MELHVLSNFTVIFIKPGFSMENKIKILLVEDEFITVTLIKKRLEKNGYDVIHTAATGENAIISAKQNLPDLILMDIRLAGEIDGIETATAIKAESDIPIIFVTGYEDADIKKKSETINPLAYLIKPLDINRLKMIIDSYFS